jgi:hypothetical protein
LKVYFWIFGLELKLVLQWLKTDAVVLQLELNVIKHMSLTNFVKLELEQKELETPVVTALKFQYELGVCGRNFWLLQRLKTSCVVLLFEVDVIS